MVLDSFFSIPDTFYHRFAKSKSEDEWNGKNGNGLREKRKGEPETDNQLSWQ